MFCIDSGIIQSCLLYLLHIFCKNIRITQIRILIESDRWMLPPKIAVSIGEERGKHGAVFHVMAINKIVPTALIAGGRQKGNSTLRILTVKVPAQIIFLILWRVHHRVIQLGSFYGNPTNEVRVLLFQSCVSTRH